MTTWEQRVRVSEREHYDLVNRDNRGGLFVRGRKVVMSDAGIPIRFYITRDSGTRIIPPRVLLRSAVKGTSNTDNVQAKPSGSNGFLFVNQTREEVANGNPGNNDYVVTSRGYYVTIQYCVFRYDVQNERTGLRPSAN
ncbi:hypothetical protein J4233_00995 [Candidatus Pacearchaeota archaeon]|nr:hypothetical protein [uncultured archaeon]AQS28851.1 hypothetical protein [uncultured archaeon]AQS29038.1 hypothetical protein [uncultured archaeon]MBS3076826.1 hypothetical protein [Candidatus Pacearchaeota archaeon]